MMNYLNLPVRLKTTLTPFKAFQFSEKGNTSTHHFKISRFLSQ